jgi:hypothetical protein
MNRCRELTDDGNGGGQTPWVDARLALRASASNSPTPTPARSMDVGEAGSAGDNIRLGRPRFPHVWLGSIEEPVASSNVIVRLRRRERVCVVERC